MLPRYIRNLGKAWTLQEIQKLRDLARKNTPYTGYRITSWAHRRKYSYESMRDRDYS